jgi:ABC-type lipoprotein release transport system permease subunit
MRAVIVGVRPVDLPSVTGTVALFAVTAVVAASFPARRAATVDPTVAIREE